MDYGPLVKEEIDAGAELIRRIDREIPVKAAFWARATDEDQRYLYIASDRFVKGSALSWAYGEVGRIQRDFGSRDLDPFRVKVIYGDSPLANAVAEITATYPQQMPYRLGYEQLGDRWVADGYIYPALHPEAAGQAG